MKTAYFTLSNPKFDSERTNVGFEKCWATYQIPILPAYAIASYTIQGLKVTDDGDVSAINSSIMGEVVKVEGLNQLTHMLGPEESTLIINYLGIKDYKCFFPQFENDDLKCRAAEFMEEADKTFDEGSWLSFVLMAGGVLESFLVDITDDKQSTFGNLIKQIEQKHLFSKEEIGVLRDASKARNLVHAGKFKKPYVSRGVAMSVRLTLEQMLRKDWHSIKTKNTHE